MADPVRIEDRLIGELRPTPVGGRPARPGPAPDGPAFRDALQQALQARPGGLKFSAHAQTRIQSRQIALGAEDVQRIEGAVQRAASKGARDSLVLLDQAAFIVSVANRTVVTVVDKENLKQNVFTNIDSAVIA
ncbi:MAG: hypothetical protein IT208_07885 [Chthonomonadales bacterium]|nr:hypothetical protein [Chthonomonadales bacterium]